MGVDHGLGGKDNSKSKLRREQKAKRAKNIAKSLRSEDVVHSKKEVKFDEAARVAWLTGFRQRKQERRKYGIAMQLLKEKKARKEISKHKKKVMLEQNEELLEAQREAEARADALGAGSDEEATANILADKEETLFEDEATQDMFGSSVSVTVQSTLDDAWFDNQHQHQLSDDESEDDEGRENDDEAGGRALASASSRQRKRGKPELSNFDRAMKKASTLLNNPKKRNRDAYKRNASREVKKKIESSKLLDKALGRMHGKGKGKGQDRGGRSKGRR